MLMGFDADDKKGSITFDEMDGMKFRLVLIATGLLIVEGKAIKLLFDIFWKFVAKRQIYAGVKYQLRQMV